MSKYVGQVKKIFDREFSGKMTYSIVIEGSPLYFRLNNKRYPGIVEVGNVVEFEATENDDGKSAKVVSPVTAGKQTKSPQAQAASGGGTTDWAAKDRSIQYQSSRKDAIEVVGLLLTSGALKLPADKAKQVSVIEAVIDRYTAQFYVDIPELGAIKRTTTEEVEEAAESVEDEE